VVDDEEERQLRHTRFVVEFEGDTQPVALGIDLGECTFPAPRVYTIAVEFTAPEGDDVRKGETSFQVLELQE
jgi:hypothetical protein